MANQIRCAHILVEKESLAKEILERIKKGESFAKLAEQYSIDGSRRRRGSRIVRQGDDGQAVRGRRVRAAEGGGVRSCKDAVRLPHNQET